MQTMHIGDLELTPLRLIEALSELGSMSKAAERVSLSQSAASHALTRIRRTLGDTLFVRTATGMRPTPYGEKVSAAVRQALGLLRDGLSQFPDFDARNSARTFNVYLSDVGQMVFLPTLLSYLKREAPRVTLRVRPIPAHNPSSALESGDVDLAIGYFTTLTAGFLQKHMFYERYVCVVREDHPAFAHGMTLKAFREVPHAFADSSGMAHQLLDRMLVRHRIRREVKLYVPQFMVLPLVIANSDLLLITPARLAEQFSKLVKLKLMPPPIKIPAYAIKAYWHVRYDHDPANRWLRGIFMELFGE